MLRFKISPTNPVASQVINAHLIVRDQQIVPGKIEVKDDIIEAQAHDQIKDRKSGV